MSSRMVVAGLIFCFTWLHAPTLLGQEKKQARGKIVGTLVDASTQTKIQGSLRLKSKVYERNLETTGDFTLERVPTGTYQLLVTAPGFQAFEQAVEVKANQTTEVRLVAQPQILEVSDLVVAPSTYSLFGKPLHSPHYLDRETIKNTPHFNDDVLRALETIPGTSSNDFGAAISVRGGDPREVLITLDGMELYEPYHLKDFAGVFSYFDPETLGGINLSTGGYAAKYGNAMSGVLDMQTAEPSQQRNIASLSLGNVSFQSEGTFAGGLGSWMFSGRRGFLDLLLSFTEDEEENEQSDISYYDSVGKISYIFNPRNKLKFQYLLAGDKFIEMEMEDGETEDVSSDYDDLYTWLSWESEWTDRLSSQAILYRGDLTQNRRVLSFEAGENQNFRDNRELEFTGLKWDWEWRQSANHFLRWGVDFRSVDASYDYFGEFSSAVPITDQSQGLVDYQSKPRGDEYSAYLSDRFRPMDHMTFEVGLRYDRQTLLDDDQISPRLNASFELGENRFLRMAAGLFHQAERAHELQVPDGVREFSKAEKSTHYLLSYEQPLGNQIQFRLEGYYKDLRDQRIRFDNLTRSLVRYPGGSQDRIALQPDAGEIYGLELVLRQDLGRKFSWFASYSWSTAEDKIGNLTVPRQTEQEHAINLTANYRIGRKWNINAAWIYHTGWHTTPIRIQQGDQGLELAPGEIFSETFPAYHRLDLRINRTVYVSQRRSFQIFVDIFNAYNRKNIRGNEDFRIEYNDQNMPFIASEQDDWLPILPSFGLSWKF